MDNYSKTKKIKFTFLIVLSVACCLLSINCYLLSRVASAYVMSSPNYRIQSDSLNVGGTDYATSPNYYLSDTLGEIATGIATSTSYNLYAGYRQLEESVIAISGGAAVTLLPNIGGISGGSAVGTTSLTVMTDSFSGYSLDIRADTSPALRSASDSFSDYGPDLAGTPDYNWSISSDTSEFGFSPEGIDIVQKFLDDAVGNCNEPGGYDTPDKCWYGLSTSEEAIAYSNSSNHPAGTETTIKFKAESGAAHLQEAGGYEATITVTAVTN